MRRNRRRRYVYALRNLPTRRASRVRVARYVLWIRLHTLLGASVCIEAVYERRRADTGVCARRGNLARNCRKETPRGGRKLVRRAKRIRPETRSVARVLVLPLVKPSIRKSDNHRMIGNERNRNPPNESTEL